MISFFSTLLLSLTALISGLSTNIHSFISSLPVRLELAQAVNSSGVQFTVDQNGLSSLTDNGNVYANTSIVNGWSSISITNIGWRNVDGSITNQYAPNTKTKTVDSDQQGLLITYPWGSLHVRYQASGDKLSIIQTITNISTSTIATINVSPLQNLLLPQFPSGASSGYTLFDTNNLYYTESPSIVFANFGTGQIAIAYEDSSRPSDISLNDWYSWYPTGLVIGSESSPQSDITPGQSYTYTVSYRFGSPTATKTDLASDVYQKFAQIFPQTLVWSDNRPILRDFLSDYGHSSATNPRGWFNNPALDISTPAGLASFKTQMLSRADSDIAKIKSVNGQGIIIWDLEGQEFQQIFSYTGHPEDLPQLAPEMDAIADQFFQKFKDAGLKIGMTLRPQIFGIGTNPPTPCIYAAYPNQPVYIKTDAPYGQRKLACGSDGTWYVAGGSWQQIVTSEAVEIQNLDNQISYAKNRWGATLFYVDSNGGNITGGVDPAEVFETVAANNPGVLIIPELEDPRYFDSTAPYNEVRGGWSALPSWAAPIYPQAKSVITMNDISAATFASVYTNLVNGVKNGNLILMGDVVGSTNLTWMNQIYTDVASGTITPPPDTTPPIISSITSSSITQTTTVISWNTDENSDTQVDYGLTSSYGSSSSLNASPSMTHTVNLSGLTPGKMYHFDVKSKDPSSNLSTSPDQTFTTLATVANAPVISSFTTSASSITSGQSPTLSWSVSGATSLSITNIGTVGSSGSQTVSPTQTTTYTLTATNASGSVSATVAVSVSVPVVTPPPVTVAQPIIPNTIGTGAPTGPYISDTAKAQYDSTHSCLGLYNNDYTTCVSYSLNPGLNWTTTPPPVATATAPVLNVVTQSNTTNNHLVLPKTLYIGLSGTDVAQLQTFLIAQGYLSVPSTVPLGYFGVLTQTAVRKFQCTLNIVCSGNEATTGYGTVGKMTRGVIATK